MHEVSIAPDSALARMTGRQTLEVNSTHHQAIGKVAEPLRAVAQSADGVIEAVELKEPGRMPFLLAVQFHPERLIDSNAVFLQLFSSFVAACACRRQTNYMKAKVMVVDDTEGVRELIGTILERNGYEPIPKANAAQLLASFTETQPDVILLDLVLPDGDGLELLPQIKKQWPDTEVIVLTGHATFDVAVEATKRGRLPFPKQALRPENPAALRGAGAGTPAPEPGGQFPAQGAGHHERRRVAHFSKPGHEGGRARPSNASPPATSPFSSPAKAARARKSSPI